MVLCRAMRKLLNRMSFFFFWGGGGGGREGARHNSYLSANDFHDCLRANLALTWSCVSLGVYLQYKDV